MPPKLGSSGLQAGEHVTLPAVQSISGLYPLTRDDNTRALVQAVMTGSQSMDGAPLLYRELTPAEKILLRDRLNILTKHLERASRGDILNRISQMIIGFGVATTVKDKDAKVIASQYAFVLQRLPMWAIERAVGKFERGEITIEQVEGVNRAFWPSTAQLHVVAEGYVGEFYHELRNVHAALHGVVEHEPTPEERARVKAGLDELTLSLRSVVDKDKAERRAKQKQWVGPTDDDLRRMHGKAMVAQTSDE